MELSGPLRDLATAAELREFIEEHYPTPSSVEGRSLKLRLGQVLLARALTSGWTKGSMFIEFPTGYGKTEGAVIATHLLRLEGRISHVLIIVPSEEQRDKWVHDGPKAFLQVTGQVLEICDAADDSAARYHSIDGVRVFVMLIQSAIKDHGRKKLAELMASGRWLVVVDEAQYYAPKEEGAAWSNGLKAILDKPVVEFWLGMSATPLRRSRQYGLLGKPDLVVPVKVGIDEGAIRTLSVRAEEYVVDLQLDDAAAPIRVHTSEIASWAGDGDAKAITAWELRHRVRYHHKFLSQIIGHALGIHYEKSTHQPGQHQMLVFAMSVRHAKHLTEAINRIAAEHDFADYIGETADPQARRTPDENKAVLERFKKNQLPCMVQVAKAGVGFDNKRCSTLLFLNLIGNSPLLLQFIGRGLRRNEVVPIKDDICHAVVSKDHPGMDLFREMDAGEEEDKQPGREGHGGGWRMIGLPAFFLLDATFDHAEIIQPFEAEERLRALRESEHPQVRELIAQAEAAAGGDILAWVKQAMVLERSEVLTKMRRAARHDQAKAQVNNARHAIVRNLIGLRNGGRKTVDSSQFGPLYNALDGEYIRLTGLPQKKMTVTDLQAKYAWLEAINDQVRARNVPDFLDL